MEFEILLKLIIFLVMLLAIISAIAIFKTESISGINSIYSWLGIIVNEPVK